MKDIILIYPTPDGSQEISLDGERLSFGRGSDADLRLDDDGLSRLNSTIYRDGDNVWIVDENSTNGTFVNGEAVSSSGTPLRNGDSIKVGNFTTLKIKIAEKEEVYAQSATNSGSYNNIAATSSDNSPPNLMSMLPIAVIAIAIMAISISAVFIGFKAFGFGSSTPQVVKNNRDQDDLPKPPIDEDTPKPEKTKTPKTNSNDNSSPTNTGDDLPINSVQTPQPQKTVNVPSGKKYLEMSETEKKDYVKVKAEKVAGLIGNRDNSIPPLAVERIKGFLDAYATRIKVKPMSGKCRFGDNLQVTYERASKNAPFIIKSFNAFSIDPQIGLYLAMIESEHCECLQSPSKPLGMFQFAYAAATEHFPKPYNLSRTASDTNGDDRCKPALAAEGAASYMRNLTTRFGTGPSSVPLAIGSYNSGPNGLNRNLETALSSNESLPRDFWTMIINGDKLSKQFNSENFKYVPKFFAAAIIGENPQDFSLTLQPLSTYTK